jgi:hypothetical protein
VELRPIIFVTLGPAGSNHELVTRRYLEFHRLERAIVELVPDFDEGVTRVLDGLADHLVQVAVHPAVARTVGAHLNRLFLVDTFIAPSRDLALLSRREVERPRSLGLQRATRDYVDLSGYCELVAEPSIVEVARGLLAGKYDSGITATSYAQHHPDRLRIDAAIGAVEDAWLVYGRERACGGQLLAWFDAPGMARWRAG